MRPRSQPEARRLPPIVGHRRERRDRLYPAVLALVVANTLNAGADIGAIAAAINLLVPIPAFVVIVPTASPRRAINPANSISSYLYAILEA